MRGLFFAMSIYAEHAADVISYICNTHKFPNCSQKVMLLNWHPTIAA